MTGATGQAERIAALENRLGLVEDALAIRNLQHAYLDLTNTKINGSAPVISGLPLALPELTALAAELKRRCGSGGTIKDGLIEIQGEHRDSLVAELGRRGFKTIRVG